MTKNKSKRSLSETESASTKSQSVHKKNIYPHKAICQLPLSDTNFITNSLKKEGEIWIPEVGKLIVQKYRAHSKMMSGKMVKIPASKRVSFRLANSLYNELN